MVSCSDGTISTLGGESEWVVTESWHGHDFEPWIATFDCWEPNTVWTGRHSSLSKIRSAREVMRRLTFFGA